MMSRYVILEHDYPVLHWDFMLETGSVLRTWRLAAPPQVGQVISAEALAEHRLQYLDYEGPVSGGRGHVKRWDQGVFTWQEESSDRLVVRVQGERLHSTARLERRAGEEWQLSLSEQAC